MPKVMAQPSAGQSRSRGRRVSTSLSEINIIPLVDVMLVLLIIFMVAAPMMQRGVEVNLPTSSRTQPVQETRLYVTIPLSYRDDGRVYIEEEAVAIEFLGERVRQVMLNSEQKDVFVRGDGAVQLQELIDVFDRLKEAGIERVGIVAQQRGAR
ncbi:MAG: biopolymer transporter ExbD [Vicinamibacterales bacterium]|nr:biopolymer transporter ExbD [Vicinamibacterales bacterium]